MALAAIYEGAARSEAAKIGGVTLQIVRDWVLRFNAEGPDGLVDRKPPGAAANGEKHRAALPMIEAGPIPAAHGVVRWRLIDLSNGSGRNSGSQSSTATLHGSCAPWVIASSLRGRAITLRAKAPLTLLKRVPSAPGEIADEKGLAADALEIWFADEARIGQKNKITRRWALRGTRPSAPTDQRTASTYIFGAICPREGKGAGLILPHCDSEAMGLHLAEISAEVAPGKHAVLLWIRPDGISRAGSSFPKTSLCCSCRRNVPELNPVENIWEFMRDNWLSNRVFKSYDDILDHCCYAWNRLIDQPWRIMSIGLRDWAYRLISGTWYNITPISTVAEPVKPTSAGAKEGRGTTVGYSRSGVVS